MQKKHSNTLTAIYICILFQSAFGTVSLRVYSRDEGLNEMNISKPRIYIQNIGDESVPDIYCYYYITTEDNKTPILDDYYTPDASVSLENLNNGNYRIRYDFSGITIDPGQIKPNPDGKVVGLHYSDWSTWDKTNDFSNTELSTFSLNGNVPVYTSDGTLIYGNEPTNPNNPPQPPKVSTGTHDYAVLSKEYTDIRDRVIIKRGDAGSGVYLEVGANSVVNGNVFSCGNMFLRSNDTIKGDAIAGENVNTQNGAVVTGTIRSHAQLEIPQLSVDPVSFGTDDVIVSDDGTIDLQPGSYKDFHAYSRSKIIMHPGDYFFNKFFLETDVNIILKVSNTERLNLNVNSSLRFGDRTTMSFEQGTAYPYSVKIYSAQTGQVFIGNTCQIYGNIICPDAEVHVYSNTNVNGALYGKKVIIEPGSEVCKPPLLQDFWHSEWAYYPSFNPTVFDYKAAVPDATVTLTISTISPDETIVTINGRQSKESTVTLTGNVTDIPILLSNSDQCGTTAYNFEITKTSNYQIFVNDDSPALQGQEDGNSWATAYKNLQQAIDRALVEGKEIWVAEGTYKPIRRVDSNDSRSATFLIGSGIEVIGSFKGTEKDKKPEGSPFNTKLTGDLNGDDKNSGTWPPAGDDLQYIDDNSYHVITIYGNNSLSIRLVNVIIENGVADGATSNNSTGGGVLVVNGLPHFEYVGICNNISINGGAGMRVLQGAGVNYFKHCLFERNITLNRSGGALYYESSLPVLINATIFDENEARDTSTMHGGGAIYFSNANANIVNSLFCLNCTYGKGGAIFNNRGNLDITNCTIALNTAGRNGVSRSPGGIFNITGIANIVNTILWNSNGELEGQGFSVNYSCIKNGYAGTENISEDPTFQGGEYAIPEGSDGRFGTLDDGLRLNSASPCIGTGTTTGAPEADIIDIEYSLSIEMGAYKYFKANNSSNCQFGRLNPSGEFYEYTPSICHGLKFPSDIRIWAGSNSACVVRIFVEKDRRLRRMDSFTMYVRGLDETKNTITGAVDIPVTFYKVGEGNGKYIFQSKTATAGKYVIFSGNQLCQTANNPYAYVICTRSLNFVVYSK